jgi:hypothetical protein
MPARVAVLVLLLATTLQSDALDKYIEDTDRFPGWKGELPTSLGALGQVRAEDQRALLGPRRGTGCSCQSLCGRELKNAQCGGVCTHATRCYAPRRRFGAAGWSRFLGSRGPSCCTTFCPRRSAIT